MSYLSWISDDKLTDAISNLFNSIEKGFEKADENFDRNVVDPFNTILTLAFFDFTLEDWKKYELFRQKQKSLTNAIGQFHQEILGNTYGWENLGTTSIVDIVNHERKIVAEVKNRHNTVKKSNLIDVYKELDDAIHHKNTKFFGYTAYYVPVIPEKPSGVKRLFSPSDSKSQRKAQPLNDIIEMDGNRFYELATGSKTALKDLYEAMITILSKTHHHFLLESNDKLFAMTVFKNAFGNI